MVEIGIVYEGHLRNRATHGPSSVQLVTDAPTDNMGKGESFSPTDLVATALGTCMMTLMGITAQRLNLDLAGTKVKVQKEMTPPPRRIAKLTVTIEVPAEVSEENRQSLERAAMTCPVHKSLHPEVAQPVTFKWGAAK